MCICMYFFLMQLHMLVCFCCCRIAFTVMWWTFVLPQPTTPHSVVLSILFQQLRCRLVGGWLTCSAGAQAAFVLLSVVLLLLQSGGFMTALQANLLAWLCRITGYYSINVCLYICEYKYMCAYVRLSKDPLATKWLA